MINKKQVRWSSQSCMKRPRARAQMRDLMGLYSGLVERCFTSCSNDFTSKVLSSKEDECLRNCADKFLNHSNRVGLRFSEMNAGACASADSLEDAPMAYTDNMAKVGITSNVGSLPLTPYAGRRTDERAVKSEQLRICTTTRIPVRPLRPYTPPRTPPTPPDPTVAASPPAALRRRHPRASPAERRSRCRRARGSGALRRDGRIEPVDWRAAAGRARPSVGPRRLCCGSQRPWVYRPGPWSEPDFTSRIPQAAHLDEGVGKEQLVDVARRVQRRLFVGADAGHLGDGGVEEVFVVREDGGDTERGDGRQVGLSRLGIGNAV